MPVSSLLRLLFLIEVSFWRCFTVSGVINFLLVVYADHATIISNPTEFPDEVGNYHVEEPMVKATVIVPNGESPQQH